MTTVKSLIICSKIVAINSLILKTILKLSDTNYLIVCLFVVCLWVVGVVCCFVFGGWGGGGGGLRLDLSVNTCALSRTVYAPLNY